MAPGPRKGADMLFPQHEAAVAGAVPGRQWPEENNLMTQEYAEMSTGRGGTSKCRYSMGAKIFFAPAGGLHRRSVVQPVPGSDVLICRR